MEEPARDGSAIKWADIRKAQEYHPEENPEGFLRLCEAYQVMLDCVQREDAALAGQGGSESAQPLDGAGGTRGMDDGGGAGGRPNPFGDGEATRQFLELYTGKRCRDSKRWLDCVTSAPFWDAAREARFTHLLL